MITDARQITTIRFASSLKLNFMRTDVLPSQAIVYDTLLISVFGGIINGFSISLCLMMNATTGGTDFISIYLSEKTGMDSFNLILGFNAILLVISLHSALDTTEYTILRSWCS